MSSTIFKDPAAREPVAIECRLEPWGKPDDDGQQQHRYKLFLDDGSSRWLIRATTILSALRDDEEPNTRRKAPDEALEIFETFLNSGSVWTEEHWSELSDPVREALANFMERWNALRLCGVVEMRKRVFHEEYGYGATVDYLAVDTRGELHAIFWDTDLSATKKLLRVGAAVGALFRSAGIKIKTASVLSGEVLTLNLDQLRECYTAFTYCADVHQKLHAVRSMGKTLLRRRECGI